VQHCRRPIGVDFDNHERIVVRLRSLHYRAPSDQQRGHKVFDYIIVGAGSAGCVAGALAGTEADTTKSMKLTSLATTALVAEHY
jgi:hypothetical protein